MIYTVTAKIIVTIVAISIIVVISVIISREPIFYPLYILSRSITTKNIAYIYYIITLQNLLSIYLIGTITADNTIVTTKYFACILRKT